MNISTKSSFIDRIDWSKDTSILTLAFSTGSLWEYYDVPFEMYDQLLNAESQGNYFNLNIRNTFQAKRISYITQE
jgi:hypothetical protein